MKTRLLKRISLWGSTAVLAASLSLCSCGKKTQQEAPSASTEQAAPEMTAQGPDLTPRPASPVALPAEPQLPADMIACVRVREPKQTIERLSPWINAAAPGQGSQEMLAPLLASQGLDLETLEQGGHAAFFAWLNEADGGMGVPLMAAVLPKTSTQGATGLSQAFDHYAVESKSQPGLDKAVAENAQLYQITQSPLETDVQVVVNVAALMDKYGAVMQAQAQGLTAMMSSQMAQTPDMDAERVQSMQRMLSTEITAGLDLLGQIQTMTIGMDFGAENLELAFTVSGREGSALQTVLTKDPVQSPDLMKLFNPGALFLVQMSVRDMQSLADLYMKYLPMMLPAGPDQQAALDQIKGLFDEAKQLGPMDVANSMDATPENKLAFSYVISSKNPQGVMDFCQSKMTVINEGVLHDLYKQMGFDMKVEPQGEAVPVDGLQVHRYRFDLQASENMTDVEKQMMQLFMGNSTIELAQMDGLILLSMGEPLAKLVEQIRAGSPAQAASSSFPAGAVFEGRFDFVKYLNVLTSQIADQQAQAQMSALTTGLSVPPVSMAGYHQQGEGYYRVQVPLELVSGVAQKVRDQQAQGQAAPAAAPTPLGVQ